MTLRASASLTASVWFAAVRALLIEHRSELTETVGAAEAALAVERLAEQVLGQLEAAPGIVQCCPSHCAADRAGHRMAGGARRAG